MKPVKVAVKQLSVEEVMVAIDDQSSLEKEDEEKVEEVEQAGVEARNENLETRGLGWWHSAEVIQV